MIYVIPKKLHAKKKRKQVTEAFLRLTPPPSILTDGRIDGRTNGRTDIQTDNSALEKLRCLSAGGTKNTKPQSVNQNGPYVTVLIAITGPAASTFEVGLILRSCLSLQLVNSEGSPNDSLKHVFLHYFVHSQYLTF